jgi:LysR family transcriptional activator of nhaA
VEWLNYHHLLYFWMVAKEGSVRRAAEVLHISQPSISSQIHQLEDAFGEKLFQRTGRSLTLSDAGQLVFRYAEDIFSLGRELLTVIKQQPGPRPIRFAVGITDTVPKLISAEILKPVWQLPQPVRVVCSETNLNALVPDLAVHRLDLILTDEPLQCSLPHKTFNHRLGGCGVTLCAAPKLAVQLRRGFPRSLHGAPALLPAENTPLRMLVDQWFVAAGVRPRTLGEFEDAAFMTTLAAEGLGFVPVPSLVLDEAAKRYGLQRIAEARGCTCQFYAVTAERRLKHPAIVAITESARYKLFSQK